MPFPINGGRGSEGSGFIMPASADYPFANISARDNWATSNLSDLIQNQTIVNVDNQQWYVWQGKSKPDTYDSTEWHEGMPIGLAVGNLVQVGSNGSFTKVEYIDFDENIGVTIDGAGENGKATVKGTPDPTKGFDLEPNANIVLDSSSAITVTMNDGTTHNAIDQDSSEDSIRLGSPARPTVIRTSEDRLKVQVGGRTANLAYLDDIPTDAGSPSRFAYWVREPELILTEEQIKKEVFLQCQPEVRDATGTRTVTITFPSKEVFERNFYIPDVNTDTSLPHIENFKFAAWLDYFSHAGSAHKIILKSDGDWLPFESSESLSEEGGIYFYRENPRAADAQITHFAFMRPVSFNPAVGPWQGWVFQSQLANQWLPLTTPEPVNAYTSDLGTVLIDGTETGNIVAGDNIVIEHDDVTNTTSIRSTLIAPDNIDLTGYQQTDEPQIDYPEILEDGKPVATREYVTARVGDNIIQSTDNNTNPSQLSIKTFQYTDAMPSHLLLETPNHSQLLDDFPQGKVFKFIPNASNNNTTSPESTPYLSSMAKGTFATNDYSNLKLFKFIPASGLWGRDSRGWIVLPDDTSLDISEGFYCTGTVSGFYADNTSGSTGVFIGTNANQITGTGVGLVIKNDGTYASTGSGLTLLDASLTYNKNNGNPTLYRFAIYVINGTMHYYVSDTLSGDKVFGSLPVALNQSNPKLYIVNGRVGNASTVAVGEVTLWIPDSNQAEANYHWRT